jgi:NitT/TauT family transport system substrate-binding protein
MKTGAVSMSKIVTLALCLGLQISTTGAFAAESLQKLRVAYAAVTAAFSLPWIAKEAGIFQRHGLDVELVYIAAGSRAVQTLVGGSIDVAAIGGPAGVDAKLAGADTLYIAIPVNRVIVFTVAEPHIQRVEELRGKMIGVGGNWGTQFYQVLEALKPSGVDKDVQLVSTGDVANGFLTLQQGSMPAVALTPPYSILAKRMGYRDLVKTSDVIPVSPTTGLVTTKEKLDKEAPKIRRAIRAVFRAVDFARTRKNETVQFIMNQYKMDKDVSDAVYDAIMETLNPTLWLTDQEVQIELNRIAEQTKMKITMKPAELADFTLTRQVAQELGR